MKIDPVALTKKLTEANVHPGFYKMLGLKGPSYKWVKCPIKDVKVGDIIKIVEYDKLPNGIHGCPEIPEGWDNYMQEQCGKEFMVVTEKEAKATSVDMAYVSGSHLYVRHSSSIRGYCWHVGTFRLSDDYENNLFYVRRTC
jgi:hypothetical protein